MQIINYNGCCNFLTLSPQGTLGETVLMYVTWTHVSMSPHACTNLAHPTATPVNVDKATTDSTARASKRIILFLVSWFLQVALHLRQQSSHFLFCSDKLSCYNLSGILGSLAFLHSWALPRNWTNFHVTQEPLFFFSCAGAQPVLLCYTALHLTCTSWWAWPELVCISPPASPAHRVIDAPVWRPVAR